MKVSAFSNAVTVTCWENVCKAFEDTYGVTVELTTDPKIADVVRPQIIAGNSPDVYIYSSPSNTLYQSLTKEKQLIDLTDIYEGPGYDDETVLKDQLLDGLLTSSSCDLYNDGHVYSAPFAFKSQGLIYNKALLERYGWELPTTWAEFLELGEKAKAEGIALLTYQGIYPTYLDSILMPALASAIGPEKLAELSRHGEGIITSEPAMQVLKNFAAIAENGYLLEGTVAMDHTQAQSEFMQGKRHVNPQTGKIQVSPSMASAMGYNAEGLQKIFDAIGKPYIEGAFMTKHNGKYYLQYAAPGTEFNTYCDGVYVADSPLGTFHLQKSNPFSAKPGGFATGAGHGSTITDKFGNYWHVSTMRISVNHSFERRVGLFPAGFDKDGILYCNQNFADYPFRIPEGRFDAASLQPEWMLLSYKKPVTVSSGSNAEKAVDEDIRTWWSAADAAPGQWITVDLEKVSDVRAIQVNLADENVIVDFPADSYGDDGHTRHIEVTPQISNYRIEISTDGENWTLLQDVSRECSNGYYEYSNGVSARYVRLTGGELPYDQPLRVSGLRVFGNGHGEKPAQAVATAERISDLDAIVRWDAIPGAQGCNIRYGIAPDKSVLK